MQGQDENKEVPSVTLFTSSHINSWCSINWNEKLNKNFLKQGRNTRRDTTLNKKVEQHELVVSP